MNAEFDGVHLLIKVGQGVTVIDVQTDVYSAWKTWLRTGDNAKFLPAIRTIGGDPTVGGKVVAPYFFLMNGWKIKPYPWDHTLNLVGNLFVDDPDTHGSNIVIPPDGNNTVLVNISTTSDASKLLVGSGVTQQDKLDISKGIWDESRAVEIKEKVDSLPSDPASQASTNAQIDGLMDSIKPDLEYMIPEIGDIKNKVPVNPALTTHIDALTARLNETALSNLESLNAIIEDRYNRIKDMVDELEPMLIHSSPKDLAEHLNRERARARG